MTCDDEINWSRSLARAEAILRSTLGARPSCGRPLQCFMVAAACKVQTDEALCIHMNRKCVGTCFANAGRCSFRTYDACRACCQTEEETRSCKLETGLESPHCGMKSNRAPDLTHPVKEMQPEISLQSRAFAACRNREVVRRGRADIDRRCSGLLFLFAAGLGDSQAKGSPGGPHALAARTRAAGRRAS